MVVAYPLGSLSSCTSMTCVPLVVLESCGTQESVEVVFLKSGFDQLGFILFFLVFSFGPILVDFHNHTSVSSDC